MNEEELRKEATATVEWESTPIIDRPLFVHAYITGAEPREKRIAELEKENVDLQKSHQDLSSSMRAIKDQRDKAKEIIKELLSNCFGYNSKTVNYEVKLKAESFLSEVEK